LNVSLAVDNTAGGTATSSDFTVTVIAGHPSPDTFLGDASGTAITIDANKAYHVNVSSLTNYTMGISGDCNDADGVDPNSSTTCAITETYVVNVSSVNAIGAINVANGTALGAAGLPTTAVVALSDGTNPSYAVTWDGGSPAYSGTTAGTYVFTGTLTLPTGVTNQNNITASVNVIVASVPAVTPNVNVGGGGGGGGGSYTNPYTVTINGGATQTASANATLSLTAIAGMNQMWISNDSSFVTGAGTGWIPFQATYPWTLTSGSGNKTVYVEFGNTSTSTPAGNAVASITLTGGGQVLGASTSATTPQGQVLGASAFNFTMTLSLGSQNGDVTALQNFLTEQGLYTGPITGYFGPLTQAAVKAFQQKYGISATGLVGPLTRAELNSINGGRVLGANTTGADALRAQIAALQAQLLILLQELAAILKAQK
jgi:hypothetical protein